MLDARALWPRNPTIPYWAKYFNVIGIFQVDCTNTRIYLYYNYLQQMKLKMVRRFVTVPFLGADGIS